MTREAAVKTDAAAIRSEVERLKTLADEEALIASTATLYVDRLEARDRRRRYLAEITQLRSTDR